MNIIEMNINEVIPYARNARKNDQAVSKVAASIKEFGWQQPIVVDSENVIIVGHTRLKAAQSLKLEKVPVLVANNLSPEKVKAYRLADNKVGEIAEWDMDLLKIELEEFKTEGFDFTLTGFDFEEIDNILNTEEDVEYEEAEGEDDIPEVVENPVSKIGDVFILGEHRLMCGDSTKQENLDKLLEGVKADMCFTDPPYLMDFTGGIHADGSKSFNAKHGGIKNDKMSKEEGDKFLDDVNIAIKNNVIGAFYITFYRLGIDWYYNSLNRVNLKTRSLIIWDKGNHTLSNSDYMSQYEPMFYGWVDKHNFYGGNNGMDIWRIKRTQKNDLHPTMKPLELVEKAINDGSRKSEIVLDLFGGSGSTMIAAEKTGRKSRLMELDEKYVDVIIKRWQDFTGKKAIHEESGLTFEELKKERIK